MAQPVIHFEVVGPDGKALQDYYGSLFDWKINADNPMSYGMVEPGKNGIAGGVAASQDGKPAVTFYVEVSDLQAALDKAEKLGGKTSMPPMDVPGGPSIAQFTDPAGNVIGLVKAM
ncbi:MAG TPA: VOC family protein [Acidimicrobiales bacterium]